MGAQIKSHGWPNFFDLSKGLKLIYFDTICQRNKQNRFILEFCGPD